jgi:N utilization substance protein B
MRRSDQRRDAVFASYQRDVTGRPLAELIGEARPLTRELAEGVDAEREDLDETISEYARGWTVDRIAPLDLNVLRVALYEIEHQLVPLEVAIDEAVEIAKEYCGADAPGFINGILGAIVRAREPANVSEGASRSDSSRPSEREAGDVQ